MCPNATNRRPSAAASYRHVLTTGPFLLLWLGVLLSYLTDRLTQLGLLELLRGSVTNLGAVNNNLTLFMMLPFVFLSPLAGPLIDRRSRRVILAATTAGKAALFLVLAVLLSRSLGLPRSLGFVYGVVALQGILTLFFPSSRRSLVPQIFDSDHLMAANSLLDVTGMFMMLVGNFVAAVLLGWVAGGVFSLRTFFLLGVGAYLGAATLFASMRISAAARRAGQAREDRYLALLRGGLRYAATHRIARRLIGLAAGFWLMAGSVYTVLNGKLLNEMNLTTDRFGYALGALGVAIFAGSFGMTFVFRRLPSVGTTVRAAFAIVGLSVLSLLWLERLALLFVPIVLMGLAGGGLVVLIITLLQRTVPRRTHGRLFCLVEACHNAALIAALFGGTVALKLVAFQTICWTVGLACLFAAIPGLINRKCANVGVTSSISVGKPPNGRLE